MINAFKKAFVFLVLLLIQIFFIDQINLGSFNYYFSPIIYGLVLLTVHPGAEIRILLIFLYTESLFKEGREEGSIFLIDDIVSELDEENLKIILEEIAIVKSQVILATIKDKMIDNSDDITGKFNQINL